MHNYAQINEYGVVISVSSLPRSVLDENMIPIENHDEGLLGKTYNRETGEFE